MREKFNDEVEKGRELTGPYATGPGKRYGRFAVRLYPMRQKFCVLVSCGLDWHKIGLPGPPWEHVSVSLPDRCPTWEEMCKIKDLFFGPEEWVVQFHPPAAKNVNVFRFCLHLWRPVAGDFPVPPEECV